jgi:hypothetical protein
MNSTSVLIIGHGVVGAQKGRRQREHDDECALVARYAQGRFIRLIRWLRQQDENRSCRGTDC